MTPYGYTVSALAGGGPTPYNTVGSADGTGVAALFNSPQDVASADPTGTVFVADTGNHLIRVFAVSGSTTTTLAGIAGVSGRADGIGINASFYYPKGVASHQGGNVLFIGDTFNNLIRMIVVSSANVSTLAGGGALNGKVSGFVNGIGSAAKFKKPQGIAVDGVSNVIFVADWGNNCIRKIILATANVTTLAGGAGSGNADGIGVAATFKGPTGLSFDGSLRLYVADNENNLIRAIDVATGVVSTLAGGGASGAVAAGSADGVGVLATFSRPFGVVFDAGKIFVADYKNNLIRGIDALTGAVTTLAGGGSINGTAAGRRDGAGRNASFTQPCGITRFNGTTFVADTDNNLIRSVGSSPSYAVDTVAGGGTAPIGSGFADGAGSAALMNSPLFISERAVDNTFYFSDANSLIRAVDASSGVVTTLAGDVFSGYADGVGTAAQFYYPYGVSLDCTGSSLFVADALNNAIRKVNVSSARVQTLAGDPSYQWYFQAAPDGVGTNAKFFTPVGVATDCAGRLFVTESSSSRIRKIVISSANVTTLAGVFGTPGFVNGIGSAALFDQPAGIAYNGADKLYIIDTNNFAVREVNISSAQVSTLAGSGVVGSADGVGAAASFKNPTGVAVYGNGTIVVADSGNNRIRAIVVTSAKVTTLSGNLPGFSNGFGAAALFKGPQGVVANGSGSIIVVDTSNNVIRSMLYS